MLVACGECGRQVSDQAAACPQCGYPLKKASPAAASQPANSSRPKRRPVSRKKLRLIAVGALILISLFLASFVSFIVPTFVPASVSWSSSLVCPGMSRLQQRKQSMYGGGSYRGGYRTTWVCVARSGEPRGRPSLLFPLISYLISFALCFVVVGGIGLAVSRRRKKRRR